MLRTLAKSLLVTAFALGGLNLGAMPRSASACPMCNQANETGTSEQPSAENLRPKAYMYSILFMLAMPATLMAGFGIGFYRLSKKHAADEAVGGETHHVASDDGPDQR